jgi:hypothetical protein
VNRMKATGNGTKANLSVRLSHGGPKMGPNWVSSLLISPRRTCHLPLILLLLAFHIFPPTWQGVFLVEVWFFYWICFWLPTWLSELRNLPSTQIGAPCSTNLGKYKAMHLKFTAFCVSTCRKYLSGILDLLLRPPLARGLSTKP